jgi:putative FmdB family regulatory protein
MPLYEYQCDACGRRFEVIQKFSDPPVETCTSCGKGPVQRLLSSPAIQFKGSGWYITDYANKGKSEKASGPTASSETKTDTASTSESKPASTNSTPSKDS